MWTTSRMAHVGWTFIHFHIYGGNPESLPLLAPAELLAIN